LVIELRDGSFRGQNRVANAARHVGMSRSALYARERLARCWTVKEYNRLLRRRGPLGARLYEAHLLAIARITSRAERDLLIERVLGERICTRQILNIIRRRVHHASRHRIETVQTSP
jgi:hypothetical protein